MAGKGLSYGLNLSKKTERIQPQTVKRRAIFDDDDSDEEKPEGVTSSESIIEFGNNDNSTSSVAPRTLLQNTSKAKYLKKLPLSQYGDLSGSFSSKKHSSAAKEVDSSIYDYDGVYDSLKPKKHVTQADQEKKPKYMSNLIAAAAVRKRDATIAEEKKLARDREAEGDEFADKEKFVTSAYKKQQEENRRLEEEERKREEEENKQNKGKGMTRFYQDMLEKGERRHEELLKAAEDNTRNGTATTEEDTPTEVRRTEADLAREINEKKSGAIAINDEGQVVDKRDLLRGGLNIVAKPKPNATANARGSQGGMAPRGSRQDLAGTGGNKQAMRDRQTRMMEAQLEQAQKRALDEEEEERQKLERASKSRKTEGDIMSAKERYLARKREAELANQAGG